MRRLPSVAKLVGKVPDNLVPKRLSVSKRFDDVNSSVGTVPLRLVCDRSSRLRCAGWPNSEGNVPLIDVFPKVALASFATLSSEGRVPLNLDPEKLMD